jgi:hypothetical protein
MFPLLLLDGQILCDFCGRTTAFKVAAGQEATEPRVRGAAPASPKIRPFGVTLVVFSMRHSLRCALRVSVYFPLGQCTDLNDPGLFEQVRQT